MSAPEPTAEHIAEARDLFEGATFIDPYGRTIPLTVSAAVTEKFARALAAAEARGFERGRAAGPAPYVDPLADEAGNRHHKDGSRCTDPYCRRAHVLPIHHKEPR